MQWEPGAPGLHGSSAVQPHMAGAPPRLVEARSAHALRSMHRRPTVLQSAEAAVAGRGHGHEHPKHAGVLRLSRGGDRSWCAGPRAAARRSGAPAPGAARTGRIRRRLRGGRQRRQQESHSRAQRRQAGADPPPPPEGGSRSSSDAATAAGSGSAAATDNDACRGGSAADSGRVPLVPHVSPPEADNVQEPLRGDVVVEGLRMDRKPQEDVLLYVQRARGDTEGRSHGVPLYGLQIRGSGIHAVAVSRARAREPV